MNGLSFVGPAVSKALHLSRSSFGGSLGAAFLGTAVGAASFGAVADYIGRRTTLLTAVALFGAGSLATTQVSTASCLVLVRFCTGCALGGLLPISSAILIGRVAASVRTTAVTVVASGSSGGAMIAGLLLSLVVPRSGWKAMFIVGGIAPFALLPLLFLYVPADNGPKSVSGRLTHRYAGGGEGLASTLLCDGAWRLTLPIWLAMALAAFPVFVTVSWLPSLLAGEGVASSQAALATTLFAVGGAIGGIVAGRVSDRFGPRVINGWSWLTALTIATLGMTTNSTVLGVIAFVAGFCSVGLLTILSALVGQYYADSLRALSVGAGLALIRVGATVGCWGAGKILDLGVSTSVMFAVCGLAALISGFSFREAIYRLGFFKARHFRSSLPSVS